MAHYPKPFFRESRGLWYVQLDGRQQNLGADKVAAFKAYHALMQQRCEDKPAPAALPPAKEQYVVVIVDEFLEWSEKHQSAATYKWYKGRLNSLVHPGFPGNAWRIFRKK